MSKPNLKCELKRRMKVEKPACKGLQAGLVLEFVV